MSKEDVLLFTCYGKRGYGKSYMEHLKEKDKEIERLNNIIKQQNTRNSRQRVANKDLQDRFNSLMEAHKICDEENDRLNNIINELEKDIKNLYTYGIKNNAEQRDYLLNRLEGLKELKGSDKE